MSIKNCSIFKPNFSPVRISAMHHSINGIQQIGIGVFNACEAFEWYKKNFGFSTIIFEDKAPASLMTRYTGDEEHQRYAVLAMNLQGGGGIEIWQYTSRTPTAPVKQLQLGNTGVFAVKLRCKEIKQAYLHLTKTSKNLLTGISLNPMGCYHFYITDPFGNIFEIVEDNYQFSDNGNPVGGVCGVVVGVSDMEKAVNFYQAILGYNIIKRDEEKVFDDLKCLEGGNEKVRRVILQHRESYTGPFSKLLGPTTIELIQTNPKNQSKIFADRYWGDIGFIHICYDVTNMKMLELLCKRSSHPFTVNSEKSFGMGKAAGHFAYNEDPDGTLIEYVETHRVPILKKIGWYLDLRKRKQLKPLPNWMVKCMGLGKKTLNVDFQS
ncbi:MAG: VOC family protein [Ferruginibacter sp.]